MSKKIVMLGLNGFNPKLVEQWSNELPNLIKIQKGGIWGEFWILWDLGFYLSRRFLL